MTGACRTRDRFIHQGTAQIIDARIQASLQSVRAELGPRCLDVSEQRIQHQSRNRMNEHRLSEGRPLARATFQIHGGFHMDKRQNHELSKPACFRLQPSHL